MTGPSLFPAATAFAEAVRGLDRALRDSRAQWDDAARQAFDRRFAEVIQAEGAHTARELLHLAQRMALASRNLDNLGQPRGDARRWTN